MADASENRRQYLAWIRTNFPDLYNATVTKTVSDFVANQSQQMGALGDDTTSADTGFWSSLADNAGSLFNTIVDTAAKVAPAYVQTKAQLDLLDVNSQRAQKGLAPLTYYNGQQVTATGLSQGSSAVNGVERALSTVPTSTWLIGGLGVAALLLFTMKRSK